jgi:hypothetical protein
MLGGGRTGETNCLFRGRWWGTRVRREGLRLRRAVPDIMAMADRVAYLLDSPDCRVTLGSAARDKAAQRHDIKGPRRV